MRTVNEGYIYLERKFFHHHFWTERRKFSKAEAWIDMIQLASFKHRRILEGNQVIAVPRGSFITSQNKLAVRWNWGVHKTRLYLDFLRREEMITMKPTTKWTYITIVKYETYQTKRHTDDLSKGNQGANRGQQKNKGSKEYKKRQ